MLKLEKLTDRNLLHIEPLQSNQSPLESAVPTNALVRWVSAP